MVAEPLRRCYLGCNQTLRKVENPWEYGSIERTIRVEASPEVVFEVVSSPDHVTQWWPDEADYEPVSTGHISWRGRVPGTRAGPFTVVDAQPPRTFSFRWMSRKPARRRRGNSLLVTFDLTTPPGAARC